MSSPGALYFRNSLEGQVWLIFMAGERSRASWCLDRAADEANDLVRWWRSRQPFCDNEAAVAWATLAAGERSRASWSLRRTAETADEMLAMWQSRRPRGEGATARCRR